MKALRTILAGSALLALSMTSCTADEQISQNTTDGAIRFSVNTANQTRAHNSYCANEMPDYFNVYADYEKTTEVDGENQTTKILYIDGDEVKQVEGQSYQSDELRYWPADKSIGLNFYAYVDADNTFKYSKEETPSSTTEGKILSGSRFEDFIVKDKVAQQLDLMYAVTKGAKESDGAVSLNFRHALSQICYKAINNNPSIEITVNSITISGVDGKGTYHLPSDETSDTYINHTDTPEETELTLNRGEWTSISEPTSYEVSLDKVLNDAGTETALTTFSKNESDENSEDSHKQTGEVKTYSNALNLIPQNKNKVPQVTNATTPADGAYFTLNLTINNVAGEDKTEIATDNFYVPVDINWAEGKRYIYTFNFPKDWDALTPITYTVNVDDFITGEETYVPKKNVIKGKSSSTDPFKIRVNDNLIEITPNKDYSFFIDLGDKKITYIQFDGRTSENDKGCSKLMSLDLSGFDTSNITDMSLMFKGCSSLESIDMSNVKTNNVTNMSDMFSGCSKLTEIKGLSGFNTSNVTNMSYMFQGCNKLKSLNLSNFKTDRVNNMESMFSGCLELTEIKGLSGFNTSLVEDMSAMFSSCENLTSLDSDIDNFDTSNVIDMGYMFSGIKLTTLNLKNFNTSKVARMSGMFKDCENLTELKLENFNTEAVTDMQMMFQSTTSLTNLNLSSFNTGNVTTFFQMFAQCTNLENLNLQNFSYSSIDENVEYNWHNMFASCLKLKITTNESFKDWLLKQNIVTSTHFADLEDSTSPTE